MTAPSTNGSVVKVGDRRQQADVLESVVGPDVGVVQHEDVLALVVEEPLTTRRSGSVVVGRAGRVSSSASECARIMGQGALAVLPALISLTSCKRM